MPSATHNTPSLTPVNFVTGMSDGLLLPFAAGLVAFPFLPEKPFLSAFAGVCIALPGACVFGLARFLGEQEEIHHHHPELAALESVTEQDRMETIGIDPELTASMQVKIEEEQTLWLDEIRANGLGWERPDKTRARNAALQTAAGFLTGGILVSLPFLWIRASLWSLLAVLLAGCVLCAALGWYKALLTGKKPFTLALQQFIWGLVVALCALTAGWFIQPQGYAWLGY